MRFNVLFGTTTERDGISTLPSVCCPSVDRQKLQRTAGESSRHPGGGFCNGIDRVLLQQRDEPVTMPALGADGEDGVHDSCTDSATA